jgi:hypothetical protein
VVDIVRIADGKLAEQWDVIQDEADRTQPRSGLPMLGDTLPSPKARCTRFLKSGRSREDFVGIITHSAHLRAHTTQEDSPLLPLVCCERSQ